MIAMRIAIAVRAFPLLTVPTVLAGGAMLTIPPPVGVAMVVGPALGGASLPPTLGSLRVARCPVARPR